MRGIRLKQWFLRAQTSTGDDVGVSELTDRYYRRLLVGGGVVVSCVLFLAAIIIAVLLSWRFFYSAGITFQGVQGQVQEKVNGIQLRSNERSQADEMLWTLHQGDRSQLPAQRYWGRMLNNQGLTMTEPDITLVPFTLLANTDVDHIPEYFAEILRVARNSSAHSLIYSRSLGSPGSVYVYAVDHSSLIVWPPLKQDEVDQVKQEGSGSFIERYTHSVDSAVRGISTTGPGQQRSVWVYGDNAKDIGSFATTVAHNGKVVAVRVVSYSSDFFKSSFNFADKYSGYYVASKDLNVIYNAGGVPLSVTDITNTALKKLLSTPRVDHALVHYSKGVFYYHADIVGPEWVVILTFTWGEVFGHLKYSFLIVLFATLFVLVALWLFILFLGKVVLTPLRDDAREVYESEAFNRTILTTLPIGVTVFDPSSHRTLLQNDKARELLGFSSQDDQFYLSLVEDHLCTAGQVGSACSGGKEGHIVDACVDAGNGEKRELSVTFIHARYMRREVVLFGLADVTEQRAAVALLEQAKEAAHQANIAKSLFLAMMSHEIRTPLHGALGNLELLALEGLTPRQLLRVTTIRKAFGSLLAIINDVLDLSKLEAKKMRLSPEPFQLDELMERCAQTFALIILEKNITFLCLVDPGLSGYWIGDGHRIHQVVMNLLSNARKFTETGTITLLAAQGEVSEDKVWVRLSVADTGIGISGKHQQHIFEPFAQADSSVSKHFGGTGLGLTVCKRVIELAGGNITVDSEPGEGSLFSAHIPLVRDSENPPAIASMGYGFDHIVVVCDSLLWQLNLVKQLQLWFPATVVTAINSEEAVCIGNKQSVLLIAGVSERSTSSWRAHASSYLDTVVVSATGALYPERQGDELHVTSFSSAMLKLALCACGNRDEVFEKEAQIQALDHMVHSTTRVLVVEDDALSRTLLEHQLEALGYCNVDSASNGREGLDHCLSHSYDIIITDLGMPIMDGRSLLSALRDLNILTPVVLSTAETGGDFLRKDSGFAGVMHKPVTIEGLGAVLDQVLGRRQEAFARARTAPAQLWQVEDMQTAFLAGWDADEKALRASLELHDTKHFLGRLHRLKGALLVLGQASVVDSCDHLKSEIDLHGLANVETLADNFLREVDQMGRRWSRKEDE